MDHILAVITALFITYRVAIIYSLMLRVRVVMKQLHDEVHETMVRDMLTLSITAV